jgi:ribonuclease P protein component
MLPKIRRVDRLGIQAVFKHGFRVFGQNLGLSYLKNSGNGPSKISFTVSKKVAKTAVERNKTRRRCYGAVAKILPEIKTSFLLVFNIKNKKITEDRGKFLVELTGLLKKIKAL